MIELDLVPAGPPPCKEAAAKPMHPVILSEAKNPRSCSFKELQRSFVVPIRSGLLRMTVARVFPQPVEATTAATKRPLQTKFVNLARNHLRGNRIALTAVVQFDVEAASRHHLAR